jgi:citrate lyase subunit beta/citryl-CoA lyase
MRDSIRYHRFPLAGIEAMTAVTARSFPRHSHDQYGIGIVDSPVVELAATEVLERESAEAAAMGVTGKLAIHPAQVEPINTAFLPTTAEIEQAQSMLAAAQGRDGAFRFQDAMVDVPHLRRAERIMALARAHALE